MPKIYQASYVKSFDGGFEEVTKRHSGTSLSKVEREARLTAIEKGVTVRVDVIEIPQPTVAFLVEAMNGTVTPERTPICEYRPYHHGLDFGLRQGPRDQPTHDPWKVRKVKAENL